MWRDVKGSWGSVFELWSSYWRMYGGGRALLASPYFHISLLITALCFGFWRSSGWWDVVISIVPMFLGFSLAGLAVFFSMSDERFKKVVAYRDGDDPSSPFLDVVVAFVNFVVWQGGAFVVAVFSKSLFFKLSVAPELFVKMLPYLNLIGWGCGFLIFTYSFMLLLAATFSIFRVARWYEEHITNTVNEEDSEE